MLRFALRLVFIKFKFSCLWSKKQEEEERVVSWEQQEEAGRLYIHS